ncbi:MAG TPA: hypothetical protein DDY98_03120 [Ruminococcaceae bacterium]|nr:hypothetical protein [Oscillospiraceae bacterium]
MNELSERIQSVQDGECVVLEKNRIYTVAPEDSFHVSGLFFSNTAKKEENPNGERFCAIYLEDKQDVTIDGNGATVMLHGVMTPFVFKNCKNITLKNLSIDHVRPTMSEYTVIESEPVQATLIIRAEFLYRVENNTLFWHSEPSVSGEPYWEIPYKGPGVLSNAFDPETGILSYMVRGEGDERGGFPDIAEIEELAKGLLCVKLRDRKREIKVGTVVQTRDIRRFQTGGAIDKCKQVTLENLRVYSMNGFGILGQNSRDLTYRNLNLTPKEGRTIVSDADFFHFSGCSGTVNVLDCRAMGAHDDIINIHGTHLRVIEVNRSKNTVLLRYCHNESWGFEPYEAGDEIEFVSGNTLLPFGSATVLAVEKQNDTDFCVAVSQLPEREFPENAVAENVTRTASLNVIGNTFERIPSRAILCTTRKDVVIQNNTFRCMGAPVICVADDANFWFESGRSGTIWFENNTVEDCGAVEIPLGCDVIRYEPVVLDEQSTQAVHEKIIIRNNTFINHLADRYTINLNYVKCAEISGNTSNVPLHIKKQTGVKLV